MNEEIKELTREFKLRPSLKYNVEFIKDKIIKQPEAIQFIDKYLNNYLFLSEMIKINKDVFDYIPKGFKNDRNFLLTLTKNNLEIFDKLPLKFQEDERFIKEIYKVNPKILDHVSPKIKKDQEFLKLLEEKEKSFSLKSKEVMEKIIGAFSFGKKINEIENISVPIASKETREEFIQYLEVLMKEKALTNNKSNEQIFTPGR